MAKLSEFCKINMGQSPDSSSYNELGNGMPFFQGNADFGEIHPKVRVWCGAPTKIAHPNDILISVRAPIGALNIADVECCIGRGLAALTADFEKCHQKYLWYALESKVDELNSKGTGSTFKAIGKSVLYDTEIPLPSISEQKEISDILDKVTTLIDARKDQLTTLETLVKSRFIEMFGDPNTNPFGWDVLTLKDIAIGKLTYGSGAAATDYDGSTRYVRITDINESGELTEDYKSPQTIDEKYLLNDGDVLFARTGATVGKTFLYKSLYGKCIYAGFLIRLVPDTAKVLPQYVFSFTKSDYYNNFVASTQRVVAQPNINAQEYGDLKICIPPIDLQNQFAEFVEQTDKLKFEVKEALEKLETLKKSLMQQYFG